MLLVGVGRGDERVAVYESVDGVVRSVDFSVVADRDELPVDQLPRCVEIGELLARSANEGEFTLRARADRSSSRAPTVGPLDEFDGDDECDGERDLVESVMDEAVGISP